MAQRSTQLNSKYEILGLLDPLGTNLIWDLLKIHKNVNFLFIFKFPFSKSFGTV